VESIQLGAGDEQRMQQEEQGRRSGSQERARSSEERGGRLQNYEPSSRALQPRSEFYNGGFESQMRQMNQLMSRMMSEMGMRDEWARRGDEHMGRAWDEFESLKADHSDPEKAPKQMSYVFSTSSYTTTGPDGKREFKHSTVESRDLDGVREGASHYSDSTGRERRALQRGLGRQERELAQERDVDGREKQVENLREIDPGKWT
jgi:hypothetical protein